MSTAINGLVPQTGWIHPFPLVDNGSVTRAVEQVPEAIVITNRAGTIEYVNPAFSRMSGFTAQEAIGRTPRLLHSGRQNREFYQSFWSTILAGRDWHGDLVNRRKDGVLYTEEMTVTPVRDPSGDITHFIAIKQDVTERRAAEEAQRFLASIVQRSEDAIVGTTLEGNIINWNPGAEKLYGFRADEVLGKSVTMMIPNQYWDDLRFNLTRIAMGETISAFEACGMTRDGRIFDISLSLSPILGQNGTVIGNAAIIRDISTQKKAERDLRASERHYRLLFENNLAGVVRSTVDGRVLDCNSALFNMLGYSADDLPDAAKVYYFESDRAIVIERLKADKAIKNAEFRFRRRDGSMIWVLANMVLIENDDGGVIEATSWTLQRANVPKRKARELSRPRRPPTGRRANFSPT
jgi:PAS domain S-box-containing protein